MMRTAPTIPTVTRSGIAKFVRALLTPVAWLLLGLIRAYQWFVSPLMPPTCRYLPTCSAYAAEAVQRHGPMRGAWFAVRRIVRCHPWGGHGYDPVPPVERATASASSDRHGTLESAAAPIAPSGDIRG